MSLVNASTQNSEEDEGKEKRETGQRGQRRQERGKAEVMEKENMSKNSTIDSKNSVIEEISVRNQQLEG